MTFSADFGNGTIGQGKVSAGISDLDRILKEGGVQGVYYITGGGANTFGYRFSQDDNSVVWSNTNESFGDVTQYPDMEDGVLYFSTKDTITTTTFSTQASPEPGLYGLSYEDGSIELSYTPSSDKVYPAVAVKNGVAYMGVYDSDIGYAIRAYDVETESIVWTESVSRSAEFEKAVVNGSLYFGSDDNLYSYDIDTGNRNWKITFSDDPRGPMIIGGTLYLTHEDGKFVSVDPSDGSVNWISNNSYGSLPPAVYTNQKLITSNGNDVCIAINIDDGSEAWTYSVNRPTTIPAVHDGYVYFGTNDGDVFRLDTSDGTEDWKVSASGNAVFGSYYGSPYFIGIQNDFMYAGSNGNNVLYAFDIFDGSEIRSIEIDNTPTRGGVLIDDPQFSYHKAPGRFSDPGK